jgi:hypothetical protein
LTRRYAGLAAIGGAAAAYILLARPRQLRWGATGQESVEPLPGDDLIVNADLTATRAITVRASADQVWPWVAQLGQGRGGFYSYDFLENLVGCDIHSADRIVPEWQDVGVGDEVKLHPEVALAVAALEPGRSLVVRGGVPIGNTPPPYDFTWAFVLRERPDGDEASAGMELRVAKESFERLGAALEANRCDELIDAWEEGDGRRARQSRFEIVSPYCGKYWLIMPRSNEARMSSLGSHSRRNLKLASTSSARLA